MFCRPRFSAILLLITVLLSPMTHGKGKTRPKVKKTIESRILKAGDAVATGVDKTAENIDLVLAGKKYTKKKNKSSVTIRQLATWSEGGSFKNPIDFGLNLKLPNVEKRWQLRFTSYDEDEERRDLNEQRVRTRPREREYGAGLLFFEQLGNVRTSFQPRLLLKDPLEMSYVLRFENESDVKPVRMNSRWELFADPKKGTGQFGSLEFRIDLTKRLDLAMQNTEEYREKGNYFVTQHSLSFDYSLTSTQAAGTAFTIVNNNKTRYHLDSYTYSLVYGQVIYPQRLTYSVTPFITFPKSEAFKGKTGITLQIVLTL